MMTPTDLRAFRRQLGLSQVKLAAKLGTSQGYIGDMELGRKPILPAMEARVRALVTVPDGLCGTCLCVIAGGVCGCREAA